MSSRNRVMSNDKESDKDVGLWEYISGKPPYLYVRKALDSEGYCIIPSVLHADECQRAIDRIWSHVEDSSNATVSRSDSSTWYPKPGQRDPFPCTSFPDLFQSNGAGWVHGEICQLLADRVFEPLYDTKELNCSKEGFVFYRPTAPKDFSPADSWLKAREQKATALVTDFHHLGQPTEDFQMLRSLVSLEEQNEGVDGCFCCWPRSHNRLVGTEIIKNFNPGNELPKRIHLSKGDVILWRSDLLYTILPPSNLTTRFTAVALTSMQPAILTSKDMYSEKMNAYKQRQTGNYRLDRENWYVGKHDNCSHRYSFRTSPPLVNRRLAELYGLVHYVESEEEWLIELKSAKIRGVRFEPQNMPTQPVLRECKARLEYISLKSSMVGQDKYLGGMASPCGDYIYGVPGSAKRVLRIDVRSNIMDMIGPSFDGKFKWLRGVEVPADVLRLSSFPRGCCLALPSNTNSVLKINPESNEVTTFGEDVLMDQVGSTGWLYHGGNLASNGMVYAIPANATHVLKVCPRTDCVWKIGVDFKSGRQKWFGGIIGSDGCIYGIPHNEVGVLKIDPVTDECSILLQDRGTMLPEGKWKWHGGLRAGDKIYGFPNNSDHVLVIDVKTQRVYTIGDAALLKSGSHRIPQDGRYKYLGGAVTLDGGSVYLFPCDAERVLKINVANDALTLVGPLLLDGENKYQNGFVADDGFLYGIPQRATGILRIDPLDDHVDVMSLSVDLIATKDKFEGGVLGYDGCIYCMPLRSKVCVKVIPEIAT